MDFVGEVFRSMGELFLAPYQNTSLLWQIIPIISLLIILEIYFGFYKQEDLGWNTALGNGISIFWIAMSLFQHIFSPETDFFLEGFLVALVVGLYSLFVIFISFKHNLSPKLTFRISSPEITFYLGIIGILFVHQVIPFTLSMAVAIVVFFLILVLGFYILRKLLPSKDKDDFSPDTSLENNFSEGLTSDNPLMKDSNFEKEMFK